MVPAQHWDNLVALLAPDLDQLSELSNKLGHKKSSASLQTDVVMHTPRARVSSVDQGCE